MTRFRPIAFVAAAVLLLAGAPTSYATHGRRVVLPRCRLPAHSRVITADTQAILYMAPEDGRLPEFLGVYGCDFRDNHRYLLGGRPEFSSSGGGGVSSEVLGGPTVAFARSDAGPESVSRELVVVDLRTGRMLKKIVVEDPISSIVVTSDGVVGWMAQTKFEPANLGNDYMRILEYQVEIGDRSGVRRLTSGAGVEPSSLALAGSTLYWTQSGKPFSASLS